MQWLAESLRVSMFLKESAYDSSSNWWTEATGKTPDEVLTKTSPQFLRVSGVILDGKSNFILERKAERIDWHLVPIFTKEQIEAGLPNVGNFDEVIPEFITLITKWLENSPELSRVALGSILLQPVENIQSGYKNLIPLMPSVHIDPIGSSDFSYTINRPRSIEIIGETISVNRMSKWNVAQLALIDISQTLHGPKDVGLTAIRLELDINTSATYKGVITKDKLKYLLDTFVILAKELSESGDVA